MSENISITIEDNGEVITATLNEAARGPAGSDATVTTTNVRAAGSLMDDEVMNLADVKSFDPDDYAAANHTHTTADITDATSDGLGEPGQVLKADGSGNLKLSGLQSEGISDYAGTGAPEMPFGAKAVGGTACTFPAAGGALALTSDVDAAQAAAIADAAAQIRAKMPDATPFDFIGFYDDFTARADGQNVGNGITAPIVGGDAYQEHYNGLSPGPLVTAGGGLRCPVDSNNYLGSSIFTPNGVLDVTFDLVSVNPASEVNSTGFTFTFKESAVVTGVGAGSGIAPSGGIHINIDSNGNVSASHFAQATPVTQLTQGQNAFQWPMKTLSAPLADGGQSRWRVNIRAYGDRLEVTSRGRTLVFQCSAISGRIGAVKTYFYFQINNTVFAGVPAPAVRNYTRLERMWANAPALSLRAATAGSFGSVFDGHPHATYPNKITVAPGNLPLIGNGIAQNRVTDRSFFFGGAVSTTNSFGANVYSKGGFYAEGKSLHSGLTVSALPVPPTLALVSNMTAALSSVANSTVGGSALLNLDAGSGFIGATPGVTIVEELCGTFGTNGNTKRIQIRDAGAMVFDSGDITQNGGAWRMIIRRQTLTAASNNYFVEFWSTATGTMIVNVERNPVISYQPISFFCTGTAVGDVRISFRRAVATQNND